MIGTMLLRAPQYRAST